jgi:CheY-like chemotaxis protein
VAAERVLLVDDEPNVLSALSRGLRGRFELDALTSPLAVEPRLALQEYAVIVSDMTMPELDGAQLLARVRTLAPDTVRVMLTGNADQATASRAINEAGVFRFVTKPCSALDLACVIEAGIQAFRNTRSERQLLEQTLGGAVQLMTEALAVLEPQEFGRAARARETAGAIARRLRVERAWEVELAALLVRLGQVTLPPELRARATAGDTLSEAELDAVRRAHDVGARLVGGIPRLEGVVQVLKDAKRECGDRAGVGGEIVRAVEEWWTLQLRGLSPERAWLGLRADSGAPREVLQALKEQIDFARPAEPRLNVPQHILLGELRVGMATAAPVLTSDGRVLLGQDQLVTPILLERILAHARLGGIREPLTMLNPEQPNALVRGGA